MKTGIAAVSAVAELIDSQQEFIMSLLNAAEGSPLALAIGLWKRGVWVEFSEYEHTRTSSTMTTKLYIPKDMELLAGINNFDPLIPATLYLESRDSRIVFSTPNIFRDSEEQEEELRQSELLLAKQLGIDLDQLDKVINALGQIQQHADVHHYEE